AAAVVAVAGCDLAEDADFVVAAMLVAAMTATSATSAVAVDRRFIGMLLRGRAPGDHAPGWCSGAPARGWFASPLGRVRGTSPEPRAGPRVAPAGLRRLLDHDVAADLRPLRLGHDALLAQFHPRRDRAGGDDLLRQLVRDARDLLQVFL